MTRRSNAVDKDFGADGIDIQTAMVRHVKSNPNQRTRTRHIMWNGQQVFTVFDIKVPKTGMFRIEFMSDPRTPVQGVDVKAESGEIGLPGGENVQTIRTWHEPRYEPVVVYPYSTKAGLLKVWNVYQRIWPDGRVTEEKWTGNAGFTVEQEGKNRWVFRCSNGPSESPDFDQLVFRLSVLT